MIDEILIEAGLMETRVALLSDQRLQEFHIERASAESIVGHIYLGRVLKVLPGMQAAFVDVGLERSAFLAARDARILLEGQGQGREGEETPSISACVHEGQKILVQVAKEPLGDKGARVTCDIGLPGRYLVYKPLKKGISISRRLAGEAERARLEAAVSSLEGEGGVVIRTAAEGVEAAELAADARSLAQLWDVINQRREAAAKVPSVLFRDLPPLERALRDHVRSGVRRVWIDNAEAFAAARAYVAGAMPGYKDRLELHKGPGALFELYDVQADIEQALEKRVGLACGGYLVIEPTEALTVIDVNTGSYTSGRDLEETSFLTNMEAAAEAARQLRLRGLGGIIVIDFIHMNAPGHVKRVLKALEAALAADRAPTQVSGMSALGLVELTRKRTAEPLDKMLFEACPACAGSARQPKVETVAAEALRRAAREARHMPAGRLTIIAAPEVVAALAPHRGALGERIGRDVELKTDPGRSRDSVDMVAG